ncbi:hypothetical protein CHS0354_009080 [Potamilus streckersoni]|uniref:G-protein coupled receptors family 1 profile domain-containing protein n=1 Tax=Potamilus streckersoni TaxID=2493646 RepID=A0AAE0WDF7_9BIVA|nr:hypothetical protein CHS0354_009080 [Potamilus streckersoni]
MIILEEFEMNSTTKEDTEPKQEERDGLFLYVAVFLMSFIIVVGCIGNILVIIVVKTKRKLQTESNIFVVNLSMCDLLYVTCVLPFNIYTYLENGWFLSEHLCKFTGFLGYTLTGTTIITITLIAFNRYKLVHDIHSYKWTFQKKNMLLMIAIAWTVPVLLLIPPLTQVWGRFGYEHMLGICNLLLDHESQLFKLFLLVFRAGIPVVLITHYYVMIYRTTRSSHRRMEKISSRVGSLEASNHRKEMHLTKMMITIFLVFIVSYFPCTITGMIDWNHVISRRFHMFCAISTYIGSAVNPLIYGLMNSQFRKAYRRLLCCCVKRKNQGSSSATHVVIHRVYNVNDTLLVKSNEL